MQKIKKGLQEKLNLISKIQNNLKIKKYDLKQNSSKQSIQLPHIDNLNPEINDKLHQDHKNSSNQKGSWMNIKKCSNQNNNLFSFEPSSLKSQRNKSQNPKILLASSYTSRFATKNSPMKLVSFNTIGTITQHPVDKIYNNEALRKTFLNKTNSIFVNSLKTDKSQQKTKFFRNDLPFYGKINQLNHISGSKFRTLDPRFGGLTREQLKQKIKNRSRNDDINQLKKSLISSSLNMYDIQNMYNEKNTSFNRYESQQTNFIGQHSQRKRKNRKQSKTKERYSPWNGSKQEIWEELPKIK